MKRLIVMLLLFHTVTIIISQTKKACDSLFVTYNKEWDNRLLREQTNKISIKAIGKCILKSRMIPVENENFVRNIAFLKSALEDEKLRQKATLLSIKMHKKLSPAQKNINEQGLLSGITPSDINFGSPTFLKKIKRNFEINVYFKILQILNIKLKNNEKKLVTESFKKIENNGISEWKTDRWSAAIVLAKNREPEAENYIIEVTKQATVKERNRYRIYDIGRDLILTKNRKIINFIIDDFLMSDYSWSDFDTSYADYTAAFDLLAMAIDESIFIDSLGRKDEKEFLRQWFKDHRETYKIKP